MDEISQRRRDFNTNRFDVRNERPFDRLGLDPSWDKIKSDFYHEFLPTVIGKQYQSPASYGHEIWEIVGDASLRTRRENMHGEIGSVFFHFEGNKAITDRSRFGTPSEKSRFGITVKRIGGCEGPPSGESLVDILSRFLPTSAEVSQDE